MKQKLKFGDRMEAQLIRGADCASRIKIYSMWDVEHWRKGEMLSKTLDHNMVSDQGLNALLGIMFHGDTQITTWYFELVSAVTTAPVPSMTYAAPGYTAVTTKIDEATRPAFNEAAAAAKSITNSANKATFTANDTFSALGAALVGGGSAATTKGDAAGGGTLFCYSAFSSSKSMVSGDVLKVVCTIDIADA